MRHVTYASVAFVLAFVVVTLGASIWAKAATGPSASSTLGLPELGAQRHRVLAEMRGQGLRLVDGAGNRLFFAGAPAGFEGVTHATFYFNGLHLDQIELTMQELSDDHATRTSFLALRRRLATAFGHPWFDRARDPLERSTRTGSGARPLSTMWTDEHAKVELSSTYGDSRQVRLVVMPFARVDEGVLAERGDADEITGRGVASLSADAKQAAEGLFYDFGEQRHLLDSARTAGHPLRVRLKNVKLPKDVAGIDRVLIERRFAQFTSGHWDFDSEPNAKRVEIELEVEVLPVIENGETRLRMRLDAFAARGKSKGQPLYSAVRLL